MPPPRLTLNGRPLEWEVYFGRGLNCRVSFQRVRRPLARCLESRVQELLKTLDVLVKGLLPARDDSSS